MGLDADVKWLERAANVDPFGSHLRVSAVASKLPSRVALERTASFLIDATTPHGDVLINENRAIKPATGWVTVHAAESMSSGVHEWSIKIENQGDTSDGSGLMLGIAPKSFCRYDSFISQGGGWCLSRAGKFYGQWKRVEGVGTSNPLVFGTGDTVVFELDTEASRLTVSVGDRFVVGEISKLTPEVFPAASLHYRQQHIYFESRRMKQRQHMDSGWFQKSLRHSCDIVCHLTRDHLSSRVDQLLARGVDSQMDPIGTSKWAGYHKLREEVVQGVCAGVAKLVRLPETFSTTFHTDVLALKRKRHGAGGDVQEKVAVCGLDLCLSLLSAFAAGTPAVADSVFDMLSEQLERQPLFSLSPEGEGSLLPPGALNKLRDAATQQMSPAALRLLVVLAVLRGEATECLRTISALLACKTPNMQLRVGNLLDRLSRHAVTYGLPALHFADDTERIEMRAAIRRAAPEAWGDDKKGEKWVVHSIASDGDYLYLATAEGIVKMGCGKGAVPTEITARNGEDFPGQPVSLALLNGVLYCRVSPAFSAAANTPAGHDLLVVDTETLKIVGHISADGSGSIPTDDNRYTALGSARPDTVVTSPNGGPPPDTQKRQVESKILTDGTLLYLVSAAPHPVARDEVGLSHPPACPAQCRSKQNCVTVTAFDPSQRMRALRTVVLGGPRPSALLAAKAGPRKALHLCKDAYVDFGPAAEHLASASGHVTIEMWLKPGTPDESKNIYVHGDKAAGGEVFIDIHSVDNGWYVKGGARVDVRNGVRSCGAVASLPSKAWVHLALVFDGRWSVLINGAVAGISRSEDLPVAVTRPAKRWLLGASYSGCITEVRVWRGARPAAVIQRDLNGVLSGTEAGLLAYWPLDEGDGRVIYDWSSNTPCHNGWISRKPKPTWRLADDLPVAQPEPNHELAQAEVSPWSVFLPFVESCGICTNGRELMVLVPDIEDAGGGQKHGLAMHFSLGDGSLIPRSDLVAPPVDSALHYDRAHNGVWYASITFQVLCWAASQCAVPSPVHCDPDDYSVGVCVPPAQAMQKLAQALNDRACRHMTHEWPALFRVLSIDPCPDLFVCLKQLLQNQVKLVQTGRRVPLVDESGLTLACLRLLRANFRVVRQTGIDPEQLDLHHGEANTGHAIYQLLLCLMDTPDPSAESREAAEALGEGLQLFFTPAKLLKLLCDLLSSGTHSCSPIIDVACLHVAQFKQSIDVLLSFKDDAAGIEGFFKLLMGASFSELRAVRESGTIPRQESPITTAIVSLQTAILGAVTDEAFSKTSSAELPVALLRHHAALLHDVCTLAHDCPGDLGLELLRWSSSGRALGFAVVALPTVTHRSTYREVLALLKGIAGELASLSAKHPAVKAVEEAWTANWTPAAAASDPGLEGIYDDALGPEDLPHWMHTVHLSVEYVAAVVAGRMVEGDPESPDKEVVRWVDSVLLSGGLREEGAPPRLCDEIVSNTGSGAQLWAALKAGSASPSPTVPSSATANEIDNALRHLYAVLVRDAQCEFPPKGGNSTASSVPPPLLQRYQRVETLVGWLMHIRHESNLPLTPTFDVPPPIFDQDPHHEDPGNTALDQLVERCRFVLRFHHSLSPTDNRVVLKALVSSSSSKRSRSKVLPPNSWRSMFYSWRAIKKMQKLLVLNNKSDETGLDLLLKFLTSRVEAGALEAEVGQRQTKGTLRAEGLEYLKGALGGSSRPVRLEALRVAARVLSACHYTSGTKGAGPAVYNNVQDVVYSLLRLALSPLMASLPPVDDVSQVQCNLVLRMLHCRWEDLDFAFLRSVNLPLLLFNVFAMWGPDGVEREGTVGGDPLPAHPSRGQGGSKPASAASANAPVASSLFNACALQSALALTAGTHPGLMRAASQFLAQSLECISHDLKHSVKVLHDSIPGEGDEAYLEKHAAHTRYLLSALSAILQALSNGVFEGLSLADYLPLLASCVLLPSRHAKLSHYAMTNIRVLLHHLSIEQADQGLACVALPDAPELPSTPLPVGSGKASIEAPGVGGMKVIRLLVEIASGTLNPGGGDGSTLAGEEALTLLRQLFLKNRAWQASVTTWLKAVLQDPPDLDAAVPLSDKKVKTFIVAINVLVGTPVALRPGVEAEYNPSPPGLKSSVVVIDVKSTKATVVGTDLGLNSSEREVDINTLKTSAPTQLDTVAFPMVLAVASKLLSSLPLPERELRSPEFPNDLGECVVKSHIISKVVRCLAMYMAYPTCAAAVLKEPPILASLSSLSKSLPQEAGDLTTLESKSLYLHSLLDASGDAPPGQQVHRPSMQQPSLGGGASAMLPSSPREESAEKRARRAAAEELNQIIRGFSVPLCMKALEVAGDDRDKAAAVLMDNSENIAQAVQEDLATEEKRYHEDLMRKELRRSASMTSSFWLTQLRHALAFGPVGTGLLTVPLESPISGDFTLDIIFRIEGDGMFGKPRLHPDVAPMLNLRVLSAGTCVEACCCDGWISIECHGAECTLPVKDGWMHVVLSHSTDSGTEVWCDKQSLLLTGGNPSTASPEGEDDDGQIIRDVLVGPGLPESATEMHPCVTTEVASLRVWDTALSPSQAEALSGELMSVAESTVMLPLQDSLVVSLSMKEGCGAEISSDVCGVTGYIEQGTLWSCVGLPKMVPESSLKLAWETEEGVRSIVEGDVTEPDVPRTEWMDTFESADASRLSQASCQVDVSLCVHHARSALRSITETLLTMERSSLWGVNDADFFRNIASDALFLPVTLASYAKMGPTGIAEGSIKTLHSSVKAWLQSAPTPAQVDRFVKGCLALMDAPPDTYIYETPTHPYSPEDVILQTIDVPGVTSYSIEFDVRCKTLDYLYIYADRGQKVQIAKFPDAQGNWTALNLEKHPSFCIRFAGDSGAPAYWGFLFTVSAKTPKLELAAEMLQCLLQGEVLSQYDLCTSSLVAHLVATVHREVGRRREKVVELLASVLGRRADHFPPHSIPRLRPLLASLRVSADSQLRHERPSSGVCAMPRGLSRYLQGLAELAVSVEHAEQAWEQKVPFSVPAATLEEARRRCYLAPSIRPTLSDAPPALASNLRCVCETTVRGRTLLFSEGVWRTVQATSGITMGRWYYEVQLLSPEPVYIGWACESIDTACGECANSWSFCGNRGYRWHGGDRTIYPSDVEKSSKWKGRDVVGVLLDLYAREMSFTINGRSLGVAFSRLPEVAFFPTITVGSSSVEVNFGETPLAHKPPTGYLPFHGGSGGVFPGLPTHRLMAFLKTTDTLLHGKTLPPFFHGLEKDTLPNRLTREGSDCVEVTALDGRPKVENMTHVKSLAAACTVRGNARVTRSGKWYYEVSMVSDGLIQIGWATDTFSPDPVRAKGVGDDAKSWAYDGCRLLLRHRKEQHQVTGSRTWREGDIVGCLLDLDSMAMRFTLNGCPVSRGQNSEAFTGLSVADWYYPAVSMDPDNAVEFNFGASPFIYQPHGYKGVGVLWDILDNIDASPAQALPDAWPFRSSLPQDAAIISLVNSLCDASKQSAFNLRLKELLNASSLRSFGLQGVALELLYSRVVLLRTYNQLFRVVYPFLDLSDAERPRGLLAEAALSCKALLLSTTTTSIMQHHVQVTNALVEPSQPKVTLNRRRAQLHKDEESKPGNDAAASMFGQLHTLLGGKHIGMFFTNRRFWTVSFQGEGAEDVGGPYRECLAEICNELMNGAVPLFIQSPNGRNNIGTHRDRMILNPKATSQLRPMASFLGKLMAACMRAGEPLPLYISPVVWKQLVGEALAPADLETIDKSVMSSLLCLLRLEEEGVTEDTFKEVYDGAFTTELSSGEDEELLPGGASLGITWANRGQYVQLSIHRRLVESEELMSELRRGFYAVLPEHLVHLFTAAELERLVCGSPVWDVQELRAQARYEGLSPEDRRCCLFWEVLEGLTEKERSLFLRFISGRERAPVRLKIMPLQVDHPDAYLPVASTCFFWISLPNYSSAEVLKQKLLYAISHCTDIDTDYRVRGSIDEDAPPTLGMGDPNDDDDFEDYTHLL